jgi:hypothetical protein
MNGGVQIGAGYLREKVGALWRSSAKDGEDDEAGPLVWRNDTHKMASRWLGLGCRRRVCSCSSNSYRFGAIELARRAHADIWSNALVIVGIVVVGVGLLIAVVYFVAGCVDFEKKREPEAVPAYPVTESAKTGSTIETPDS